MAEHIRQRASTGGNGPPPEAADLHRVGSAGSPAAAAPAGTSAGPWLHAHLAQGADRPAPVGGVGGNAGFDRGLCLSPVGPQLEALFVDRDPPLRA